MLLLYPLLIVLIEGIIPIIIKLYLTTIPYHFLLLLTQILGAIFIGSYVYLFKPHEFSQGLSNINAQIFLIFLLIAFFGTFLAKKFYLKVINDNPNISIFIIIMSLYPIITIIGSYFFLKERLSYYQLLGYFLIILGIFLMFYKN
jgi:drug/metabolite transporter (DMT)-like permease